MRKLVLFLGLMILAACGRNASETPSKFKTMMIKSSGEVEVMPDMATFNIDLSCMDKSIKVSKECLVVKSNELNDKLLAYGISKDDLMTTFVNLEKSYTWVKNAQVFEGYKSSTSIQVKLKDLDKLENIYTDLLENENLELGGLYYSHSKEDSLKNEAYLVALKKSEATVDKLLEHLPESKREVLKVGNVEISETAIGENKPAFHDESALLEVMDFNVRSISISRGLITVNATLYVEYQIR